MSVLDTTLLIVVAITVAVGVLFFIKEATK